MHARWNEIVWAATPHVFVTRSLEEKVLTRWWAGALVINVPEPSWPRPDPRPEAMARICTCAACYPEHSGVLLDKTRELLDHRKNI
jgi:hypothetical protein